ncbi:MAG TPA: formate dehydrogenase accessory sulfurtransferase FdhD, partial [Acidimicrobiia bacterium]|nr:formate dehydrogenase accessory sulfurtransferase FdhD [Acidimicrobiia bacterium]
MRPGSVRRATTTTRVQSVDGDDAREQPDRLVTEEPMEIRLQGPGQASQSLAVTMRTPGKDFELAAGFCLTEGVIETSDEVAEIAYCVEGPAEQHFNIVTVRLRRPVDPDAIGGRRFAANASCGL